MKTISKDNITNTGTSIPFKNVNLLIRLIIIASFALGIVLRVAVANNAMLEYDEIWTIQHYSVLSPWQIFNDLSVPNNHPLNSIAVKLTTLLLHPKHNIIVFRISSLLASCFLLAALLASCRYFCRKRTELAECPLLICAMLPVLFSPGLVHYSAILRGYAIQSLFVFAMYAMLLILATEGGGDKKTRERLSVLGILCGLLTAFSITSGAIFCFAAGVSFLVLQFRGGKKIFFRQYRTLLVGGMLAALVVGLWLGVHVSDIRNAQTFGSSVMNPVNFLSFVFCTCRDIGILVPLLVMIGFDVYLRRKKLADTSAVFVANFCYLFLAISLLSALLTGAGPARVYLPVCAPFYLTFGLLAQRVFGKLSQTHLLLIGMVVFVLCTKYYQIEIKHEIPRNLCNLFLNEVKALPDSTAIIYPTGNGYELQFNLTKQIIAAETRRHFSATTDTVVLLQGHPLTAMGTDQGETSINLYRARPVKSDANFDYYHVARIAADSDIKERAFFAKVQPVSLETFREISSKLHDAGFLMLNPFLDSPFSSQENPAPGAFFAADDYPYTLQDLLNFEEDYPAVSFYTFIQ